MLFGFFLRLTDHRVPTPIKQWFTLLEPMQKNVISPSIDDSCHL
jgi:uncharacterized protein with von Willebrand factor type A (vWA) domain